MHFYYYFESSIGKKKEKLLNFSFKIFSSVIFVDLNLLQNEGILFFLFNLPDIVSFPSPQFINLEERGKTEME